MEIINISNFKEFHDAFACYRYDTRWVYRGQSNSEWALIPKAGRSPYNLVKDKVKFQSWKRKSIEYVDFHFTSDWDWLAIAQHNGLATI